MTPSVLLKRPDVTTEGFQTLLRYVTCLSDGRAFLGHGRDLKLVAHYTTFVYDEDVRDFASSAICRQKSDLAGSLLRPSGTQLEDALQRQVARSGSLEDFNT